MADANLATKTNMDYKIRRIDANVWHKGDGVGHASLDLWNVNGNYAYISLWPREAVKKKKAPFALVASYMPESYEEDCSKIGRHADTIITIEDPPNPTRVTPSEYRSYWQKYTWGLTKRNCCYVVICVLGQISGKALPKARSWHGVFDPFDVIHYAYQLRNSC